MIASRMRLCFFILLATLLPFDVSSVSAQEGSIQQTFFAGPYQIHPTSNAAVCTDVSGGSAADGTAIQSFACNGTEAQSWIMAPVASPLGSGYEIVSSNSGSCLTPLPGAADHAAIQQSQCRAATIPSQIWQAYSFGASYELVSLGTGQCLNLPNGNSGNGNQLQQTTCAKGSNSNLLWSLTASSPQGTPVTTLGAGPFRIQPVSNSSACADVSGGSAANGTAVQVYGCNGTSSQSWLLAPITSSHGSGYQIIAGNSSACLDIANGSFADGAKMAEWQCLGSAQASQIWQLYLFGSSYELVSLNSGKCLDLTNGDSNNQVRLQQWTCGSGTNTNQLWSLAKIANEGTPALIANKGPYQIQPISNAAACSDVSGGNQANGANIQSYACNGTLAQSWSLVPISTPLGNTYQLVAGNSNACMDISNSSMGDGAVIQQWQCLGASQLTQMWQLYPFGSSYELVSVQTGKCLDLTNGRSSNGVQLQQWACAKGSNSNQLWKLTKATTPITTSTVAQATPLAAVTGQTVVVSTTVSSNSGFPVGSLSVYDGTVLMGAASVSASGSATFTLPQLANGTHSITVQYPGSGLFLASASVPVSVTVAESSVGEQALQADAFVDSVGVATHLSYDDTPYYSAWPQVFKELKSLGVRHIRDGIDNYAPTTPFVAEFQALSAAGIKGTFILPLDYSISTLTVQNFATSTQDVEALEAPNECDAGGNCGGGGVTGINNVIAFLPHLNATAKALKVPVIGPSFTDPGSYEISGNISSQITFNNLHVYLGGRNPGNQGWGGGNAQNHRYGSLLFWIDQANDDAPNVPTQITETGYLAYPTTTTPGDIPESVEASYIPRTLLLTFNSGIKRTFLYELLDEVSSPGYGLLRADLSEKPAYVAVKSLLGILSDPGASFTPGKLDYTLSGGDSTLSHTLVQKRDGSFWLVLWSEQSSYDSTANVATPVTPQSVSLTINGAAFATQVNQFDTTGSATSSALSIPTQTLALHVSDQLTMVHITPP